MPHAFVGSYFKVLPSGKWDFHLPEDPAAREAYRPPIGFVTTGFVRGRFIFFPFATIFRNFVSQLFSNFNCILLLN